MLTLAVTQLPPSVAVSTTTLASSFAPTSKVEPPTPLWCKSTYQKICVMHSVYQVLEEKSTFFS